MGWLITPPRKDAPSVDGATLQEFKGAGCACTVSRRQSVEPRTRLPRVKRADIVLSRAAPPAPRDALPLGCQAGQRAHRHHGKGVTTTRYKGVESR